jgi:hypothetical protein
MLTGSGGAFGVSPRRSSSDKSRMRSSDSASRMALRSCQRQSFHCAASAVGKNRFRKAVERELTLNIGRRDTTRSPGRGRETNGAPSPTDAEAAFPANAARGKATRVTG